MNLLSLEHLTKTFADRKIFDDASFFLQEGEKVGIIGINGTGKSTLLKLAAGLEEPDEGNRTVANHAVIQYLPQNPVFPEGESIFGYLMARLGKHSDWDVEGDVKTMLNTLGILDIYQDIRELSGGQRKRLALAEVLLKPCDILILDEPTNHLDHKMADWLERYLKKWRGSLLMVTHDRYFLDSVSNRIIEIDKGSIYNYDSNYSGYLELKAQREEMEQATERKRQSVLRTELEWVKRGARARSTKQKARLERYEDLKNQTGPQADGEVAMSSVSSRMGNATVEIRNLSKSFGSRVLIHDFSYTFLKNDRIGFVGENGCGKTTLMKLLIGTEQPDQGEINIGQTIKIGYYSQEIEEKKEAGIAFMDPAQRVIDYIRQTAEFVRTEEGLVSASVMLERFLFAPDQQYNLIGKLSGGEKRRLNLLRVLMEAPNVLILDEPTNDLDITTLAILENYLDHFQGIVITVSHDRYFLDRIVRRIFAFEEGGNLKQYEGGYTDYAERAGLSEKVRSEGSRQAAASSDTGAGTGKKPTGNKKLKFSFNEQREYGTIEQDIEGLEEKIGQIESDILKFASDFVKLNQLTAEKEEAEHLLEEKMQRWEYLEELAEKINAQE